MSFLVSRRKAYHTRLEKISYTLRHTFTSVIVILLRKCVVKESGRSPVCEEKVDRIMMPDPRLNIFMQMFITFRTTVFFFPGRWIGEVSKLQNLLGHPTECRWAFVGLSSLSSRLATVHLDRVRTNFTFTAWARCLNIS